MGHAVQPYIAAVVLAAGASTRFESTTSKQLLEINAKPVIAHTVAAFQDHPRIAQVIVVVPREQHNHFSKLLKVAEYGKIGAIVEGGRRRQDSVKRGLEALSASEKPPELVLIHDGARPCVSAATIDAVIAAGLEYGAAVPGLICNDAIKRGDDQGYIKAGVKRDGLAYRVQTPQAFRWEHIWRAHNEVADDVDDDAAMLEQLNIKVRIVPGQPSNVKLSRVEDIPQVRAALAQHPHLSPSGTARHRVGIGADVHRMTACGPLKLGGAELPFELGLEGLSDGDVLLHSVARALLGAAGLGDLGEHFPNDPRWEGIGSDRIVARVLELVTEKGLAPVHIDAVIIAQKPRLASYLETMVSSMMKILNVERSMINLQVTSTDGTGIIGAERAIGAQAAVTLEAIPG